MIFQIEKKPLISMVYMKIFSASRVKSIEIQLRPGIGSLHKAEHPVISTTFGQSRIFPHPHNALLDLESGPTRDSGHGPPFFSPKGGLTKRTSLKSKRKIIYTVRLMGETAAWTKATSCCRILWCDQLWLYPLRGPGPWLWVHNRRWLDPPKGSAHAWSTKGASAG